MQETKEDKRLLSMVVDDVYFRLRELERLPPRVQALESSITEIRKDVREGREEQHHYHQEAQQALSSFRDRMDADSKDTADAITTMTYALGVLGRKLSFASGAVWVVLGLSGIAITFKSEFIQLIQILGTT